ELVAAGVVLSEGGFPQFEYTRLNDIKPELIAEATANARAAAEQFALDSGARVGGIRSANQGVIDISDRDFGSPQVNKVRGVTTVEYFLRDWAPDGGAAVRRGAAARARPARAAVRPSRAARRAARASRGAPGSPRAARARGPRSARSRSARSPAFAARAA